MYYSEKRVKNLIKVCLPVRFTCHRHSVCTNLSDECASLFNSGTVESDASASEGGESHYFVFL